MLLYHPTALCVASSSYSASYVTGEDKRFRTPISSLQYAAVLLTGDYPLVDFSYMGNNSLRSNLSFGWNPLASLSALSALLLALVCCIYCRL